MPPAPFTCPHCQRAVVYGQDPCPFCGGAIGWARVPPPRAPARGSAWNVLYGIVGTLGLLWALAWTVVGLLEPAGYVLTGASAPQVAQVYSQATYHVSLGLVGWALAILCAALAARA